MSPGRHTSGTCIIVGASHAAAQLAPSLRQRGWDGRILVIGEEDVLPYHRPPLSKTVLSGAVDPGKTLIRQSQAYEKAKIEFMLGKRVTSVERHRGRVRLNTGETANYDKLALCTGSRVREVALPGSTLPGIHYLRNAADVARIKQDIGDDKNVVIVGGGYIGLETAAVLSKLCNSVTVLEMAPRILARVAAAELSEFYTRIHTEEGVKIRTGTKVSQFEGIERIRNVVCSDGSEHPADIVIIGVGVLPNVELAKDAGLEVNNGIVIDEHCCTADPNVFAAGDCTNQMNVLYNRSLRLESVPNATEQAKVAAASICGSTDPVKKQLPWFWSDQYDLKLQIAGLGDGHDAVVIRGDRHNGRSFAAFYLKQNQLIAADCVNRPKEFAVSKRLISEQISVDANRLSDENIQPSELLVA